MENEDLLGPGCFLIWEKPWTQCFLLHGTFSTVRFAERGKREPATVSATGRKKPSGPFLGHVWDEHLGI